MSSQSIINANATARFSTFKKSKRQKRQKIVWNQDYKYAKSLISRAALLYNWKIEKPKRLGYIRVNAWSNEGKEFNSDRCIWGYKDPNSGFIYIGNREQCWKLGLSHKYYHHKYPYQTEEIIMGFIHQLDSPIL